MLVMKLVEDDLAKRDPQAAVALLAPVVAANPLHEPVQRVMMRALAGAGRQTEALVIFERLRAVLRQELAAEPDAADPSAVPRPVGRRHPRQRAHPARANLPARVAALVGRERELEETARILADARLLTLTGPGGAGKTTLASSWLAGAASAIATAPSWSSWPRWRTATCSFRRWQTRCGCNCRLDRLPVDSLVAQLHGRQLLIVLDNCEHLIDACARTITELLQGCPEVSVLATSREPLRIEGEISWRTPSLDLPDPEHLPSLEACSQLSRRSSCSCNARRRSSPGFALTGGQRRSGGRHLLSPRRHATRARARGRLRTGTVAATDRGPARRRARITQPRLSHDRSLASRP